MYEVASAKLSQRLSGDRLPGELSALVRRRSKHFPESDLGGRVGLY